MTKPWGELKQGGSGSRTNHKAKAYSARHQLWLDGDEDGRNKSLETDTFWGGTRSSLMGILEYIIHP